MPNRVPSCRILTCLIKAKNEGETIIDGKKLAKYLTITERIIKKRGNPDQELFRGKDFKEFIKFSSEIVNKMPFTRKILKDYLEGLI